jgi:uncharacterized protein
MDARFHPAMAAIKSGDIEKLKSLLNSDPGLAAARSSKGHPTLLQCLALEARDVSSQAGMAKVLIEAGAEINEPLVAAASGNNAVVAAALLDSGAEINGTGTWSPLEEALYWDSAAVIELLVARGASAHNLRIAAGLGRIDLIESFFNRDGRLMPEAGKIDWPFGGLAKSNLASPITQELQQKIAAWSHDQQSIINNALIYACMHNHIEATKLLLERGAEVNAIPPGFDFAGTALHNAAVHGHREMVEFLIEHGADATIKDQKVNGTPAGWAAHGGHKALSEYLERMATGSG